MLSAAFSIAARTLGRGPCTVSLLAILIAPGTVLPGVYAGRSASSGRRRTVTRPVYGSLTCALPSPVAPVYAVGSAVNVRRRARAAEWGSLLMSCRPQRRPEVQILSPPPMLTRRPYNLMTCARSSTDRASDYGSEGWGFESLRARHLSAETLKAPIATRPSVDTFRHHFPRRRTDRGIPARQARRSGLALQIVRFCGREFRVAELSLGRGRGRTTVY